MLLLRLPFLARLLKDPERKPEPFELPILSAYSGGGVSKAPSVLTEA